MRREGDDRVDWSIRLMAEDRCDIKQNRGRFVEPTDLIALWGAPGNDL